MIKELGTTEQVVLQLLANELFGTHISLPDNIDWALVYDECKKQSVLIHGLLAAKRSANIPESILKQWEMDALSVGAHNYQNIYSHQHLDEMMKEGRIPYVVLKGYASARYYPKPEDRTMGDVDFLVKPEDLDEAGEILKSHGFVPWNQEHICHIVYRQGTEHLEMHFEPAGIPYGEPEKLVRQYLSNILDTTIEVTDEDRNIVCPSDFHHGLILLLHTSHHMLGEGIGLRHLCDWGVFVNSFTKDEFIETFKHKLSEIGLWHFACILTKTAITYLHCPDPGWTENIDDMLIKSIILDIFTGGNFGRKQEGRVYETYLISSRGKDGVGKHSLISQLVISINEMIRTNWPRTKRYPILIPIGWIYYGGRYAIRILTGKRPPIHLKQIRNGAVIRKSIYEQLKLFDK